MGFLQKLFGQTPSKPDIHFGRFSDAFKNKQQLDHWELALSEYDKLNYKASFIHVLEYLNNPADRNIQYKELENGHCNFSLIQGSKVLEGEFGPEFFRAETKIGKAEELNIGFLRKSIESNFDLRYGRYALSPDNVISLIFDSYVEDCSPYKIYYGMREIAVQADRYDDVMVSDYPGLTAINIDHIIPLDANEKKQKIEYFKFSLTTALADNILGSLNPERFPGALTFIYLDLIYKLDYLLKPEAQVMDDIENMHKNYFSQANEDPSLKVKELQEILMELQKIDDKSLDLEFYNVIATFGITNKVNMSTILPIIEAELKSWDWYYENKHYTVCNAICGYIIGYCTYNFTLPEPTLALMHLYYEITEPEFFSSLGFQDNFFDSNTQQFNKYEILNEIDRIVDLYAGHYKTINKKPKLNFESKPLFLKSFVDYIYQLNIP